MLLSCPSISEVQGNSLEWLAFLWRAYELGLTHHRALSLWVHSDWPKGENTIQSGLIIVPSSQIWYTDTEKLRSFSSLSREIRTVTIHKLWVASGHLFLPENKKVPENKEIKTEEKTMTILMSSHWASRSRSTPEIPHCEEMFLFGMSWFEISFSTCNQENSDQNKSKMQCVSSSLSQTSIIHPMSNAAG